MVGQKKSVQSSYHHIDANIPDTKSSAVAEGPLDMLSVKTLRIVAQMFVELHLKNLATGK